MKRWLSLVAALGVSMGVLGIACTREAPNLGPVTRLNEEEGDAGTFSWAYYTSVVADGDRVAVSWMNQNGKQNRDAMARRSLDRGATWGPEVVLNAPDYANTISVVPTLHLLPKEGELLALWQARRNEAGQKFVLVRRSRDFGATWDETSVLNQRRQSFLPVYAQRPDGGIVVAWTDERNVFRDIYANRSLDGGTTWLDRDVRVSQKERSEAGAPALAIGTGDDAVLVWEERPHRQDGNSLPHLSVARSSDLGATWTKPKRLETGDEPLPSPMWPQLVFSEGRLVLVWAGGVTGDTNQSWLWMSSSTDGGRTWADPVQLYEGGTQPFFHLKAKGPHVYLAWHGGEDARAGSVYWNASDDGGKTWRRSWDDPLRLDAGKAVALHPRVAVAPTGDEVAVTWQEGYSRVVVSASPDSGRTWPVADLTVVQEEEGNELRNPQAAISGGSAYVLWERWPDKKKHIKTFADVDKVLPRDVFVRRVDLQP